MPPRKKTKRRPQVTEPRNIQAREREVAALELRKAGATYQQIGKRLGVSTSAAHMRVKKALFQIREISEDKATEVRDLELHRLDAMLLGLWERARRGDDDAVRSVLRIMTRRATLLGIDAPTRSQFLDADGKPLNMGAQVVMYWPDNGRGPTKPDGG